METARSRAALDLPISIDDAIRFVVSGGVIMPASRLPSQAETGTARRARPLPALR